MPSMPSIFGLDTRQARDADAETGPPPAEPGLHCVDAEQAPEALAATARELQVPGTCRHRRNMGFKLKGVSYATRAAPQPFGSPPRHDNEPETTHAVRPATAQRIEEPISPTSDLPTPRRLAMDCEVLRVVQDATFAAARRPGWRAASGWTTWTHIRPAPASRPGRTFVHGRTLICPIRAVAGQGLFSRQRDAREQAMVASLANMGLSDMAAAQADCLRRRGSSIGERASNALDLMQEGRHDWRTKWARYAPQPNFQQNQQKRIAIRAYQEAAAQKKAIYTRESARRDEAKLFEESQSQIRAYNSHIAELEMWDLKVSMPFKKPGYVRVVYVDAGFKLEDFKLSLYELEGFHPAQQILYVLEPMEETSQTVKRRVPKKLQKQLHARAFESEIKYKKILLPRESSDEQTLASLGIVSTTVFEMEIDKAVGKELQRQMLMKEIGVDGDTFLTKTQEAFEKFDVDEGGTIEADELGMTMKSLGIYLTEEEINDLIEKYDENGDCEFDLGEFRAMVKDIITGDISSPKHPARRDGHGMSDTCEDAPEQGNIDCTVDCVHTVSPRTSLSPKQLAREGAGASNQVFPADSVESFTRTCSNVSSRKKFSRSASALQLEADAVLGTFAADESLQRSPSSEFLWLKVSSEVLSGGWKDKVLPVGPTHGAEVAWTGNQGTGSNASEPRGGDG